MKYKKNYPKISENFINPTYMKYSFQQKLNLLDMTRKQLRYFFSSIGEKPFHADQVMRWIYHYYYNDFDQMTDINKDLRLKLKRIAEIRAPEIIAEHFSVDGTIKWAIKIGDQQIETVYIPEKNRSTLCVSSQIGCTLKCTFCSTAQQGFNRNLRVSEIIGQLWIAAKTIENAKINCKRRPITNVVMMGMGEPLLNIKNVVPAMEIMLDNLGFGLSKRRVTLSTAGIVPAIEKLGNMIDVALAISLHAPNDKIRNKIMPINRKYNIEMLLSAVRSYIEKSKTNKRITVEYVMLNNINDKTEHAHQLAACLKNIFCKINIIPWNPFPGAPYICSSNNRVNNFVNILIGYGFTTIIRKTRGDDINAACGQLAGKVNNCIKRIL